jgi:ribulose-phosphate 3-epimerase
MLLCDFGHLEEEVRRLESAGVSALHLDVMDGHFVPNLTYGMPIVAAIRRLTDLPLDVHLMIADPGKYVDSFCEAGADILTIHAEARDDPVPVLQRIRSQGVAAGLAVNPGTPLEKIAGCYQACDMVLAMSVEPGFGGQSFNPAALGKLEELRQTISSDILLEIDGGVNDETIGSCAGSGAELLVVGSAIFRHQDYEQRVATLTNLARAHYLVRESQ